MNYCSCQQHYPDVEYLKSMYPKSIFYLYEIISDFCDQLEYEGSFMFDEFPDHELVFQLVQKIMDKLPTADDSPSYLQELVTVLLLNEFLHRRIRKKEF